MPESIRQFIGVKDVAFTPEGGSQIVFPMQDGDVVEHRVLTEEIRHTPASGRHVCFAHTARVIEEVVVHCKDYSLLDDPGLAVGTVGTLTYTLVGAGLADGNDRVVSATAKVAAPSAWPGTDGTHPSRGSVRFILISPDGTTDPKAIT